MKKYQNLMVLLIILLLDATATNIVLPIITQKFALKDLGFDPIMNNFLLEANFSMLLSSSYIFFSPVIGFLSDIIGRKKIICWCLALACLGYILILIGLQLNWAAILLLPSLMMLGIGSVFLPISLASLADIFTGKMRIYAYSLIGSIFLFSMQTTWLSTYLLTKTNFLFLMYIALMLEITAFLIAINYFIETYSTSGYFNSFSFVKLAKRSWHLITSKEFLILAGIFIIFEFSWGSIEIRLANYLGLKEFLTYISLVYHHVIMIGGALILLPLLLRFLNIPQLLLGALITIGITLVILAFFSVSHISQLLIIPSFLSIGLLLPLFWWMFSILAKERHYGLVMGIVCPLWCLGWDISGMGFGESLNITPVHLLLLLPGVSLLFVTFLAFYFKPWKTSDLLCKSP